MDRIFASWTLTAGALLLGEQFDHRGPGRDRRDSAYDLLLPRQALTAELLARSALLS